MCMRIILSVWGMKVRFFTAEPVFHSDPNPDCCLFDFLIVLNGFWQLLPA